MPHASKWRHRSREWVFLCLRGLFVECCLVGSLISVPDVCHLSDEHSPGGTADSASSHIIFNLAHASHLTTVGVLQKLSLTCGFQGDFQGVVVVSIST